MLSYTGKAVSKWESGLALPPSEVLPELARILNTDLNSLFNYKEDATYFLGVDGGGTKTKFMLSDINGNIIKELVLGACNPTSVGMETTIKIFTEGIKEICADVPLRKVSAFIGSAGCGIKANQQEVSERLESLNFSKLTVGSDAQNIISAGLRGSDGVTAILGTGSIIYATYKDKQHRIGGYGHFIGDTFSGSELGRACLEAVFSDLDKSGPKTSMTKKVVELKGDDVLKILSDMYKKGKTYMAELAYLVFECAREGDKVAIDILNQNIEKLAKRLSAALSQLPSDNNYPIVLAGGITENSEMFIEELKKKITATNFDDIKILTEEPVLGAVLLARRNSN